MYNAYVNVDKKTISGVLLRGTRSKMHLSDYYI